MKYCLQNLQNTCFLTFGHQHQYFNKTSSTPPPKIPNPNKKRLKSHCRGGHFSIFARTQFPNLPSARSWPWSNPYKKIFQLIWQKYSKKSHEFILLLGFCWQISSEESQAVITSHVPAALSLHVFILLMEELLHHPGCKKPCK